MRISRIALASFFVLFGCSQADQTPPPDTAKEPANTPTAAAAPATGETKPAVAATAEKMLNIEVSALQWKDIPEAEGVKMAPVWKDPQTNASAFFIKAPAGWSHPDHFHTAGFQRVVVEGDFEVTMKDGTKIASKKGDYVKSPANAIHKSATKKGVTMFIVTDGKFGTVTLGDDGKPKKATDPAPGPVTGKSNSVTSDKLEWKDIPDAKGVKVAQVAKNATTGSVAMFVKFDANVAHGPHTHPSSFHRVMIDGAMFVEADGQKMAAGAPGDYFRGIKDQVHQSGSKTGGMFFLVSDGKWGTVFVDKDGKPLPAAKKP